MVSPLVLSTTRGIAGVVSAVAGGPGVAVLAGWALAARNQIPPLAIACFFGLWLVLVPSLWEFRDGVDSGPGLVPLTPAAVIEPARAVVARAEWNFVLAGPAIVLLADSALLAGRRQGRPAAGGRRPAGVGAGPGRDRPDAPRTFLAWDLAGGVLWATTFVVLGFAAGPAAPEGPGHR